MKPELVFGWCEVFSSHDVRKNTLQLPELSSAKDNFDYFTSIEINNKK
jgi:hypothetical protein